MVGKVGAGGSNLAASSMGIDGNSIAELAQLEEELARIASSSLSNSPVQPQLNTRRAGVGDRAGAQAVMNANVRQVPAAPQSDQQLMEKELAEKLQKLGYLPEGNFTREQFEQATQRFVMEHRDDMMGVNSIDDLLALVDRIAGAQNARRNTQPRNWGSNGTTNGVGNAGGGASRPGEQPSRGSYENAGSNRGALESQPVNPNPPPPGQINESIANATRNAMGMSTRAGPDGGNLACAWSVNKILGQAGIRPVGSNPNYVPSVEQALNGQRGTRIDPSQARPGDIVIWPNGHHIGVYMGDGKVANNSSSRAAFVNMSNMQSGMRVYRVNN